MVETLSTSLPDPQIKSARQRGASHVDFKSATSAVASKEMRNELNEMIEGIEDPAARKAFESEMASFYHLFNRFLVEKARDIKLCVHANQRLGQDQVTLARAGDPLRVAPPGN